MKAQQLKAELLAALDEATSPFDHTVNQIYYINKLDGIIEQLYNLPKNELKNNRLTDIEKFLQVLIYSIKETDLIIRHDVLMDQEKFYIQWSKSYIKLYINWTKIYKEIPPTPYNLLKVLSESFVIEKIKSFSFSTGRNGIRTSAVCFAPPLDLKEVYLKKIFSLQPIKKNKFLKNNVP